MSTPAGALARKGGDPLRWHEIAPRDGAPEVSIVTSGDRQIQEGQGEARSPTYYDELCAASIGPGPAGPRPILSGQVHLGLPGDPTVPHLFTEATMQHLEQARRMIHDTAYGATLTVGRPAHWARGIRWASNDIVDRQWPELVVSVGEDGAVEWTEVLAHLTGPGIMLCFLRRVAEAACAMARAVQTALDRTGPAEARLCVANLRGALLLVPIAGVRGIPREFPAPGDHVCVSSPLGADGLADGRATRLGVDGLERKLRRWFGDTVYDPS